MPIPGFRGQLLRPDHHGYDQARQIFNRHFDRHPALIARPADVSDVVAAVRFASETGLPLVARGGGHNFAGHAASDGGLVLDLRTLLGISVDPKHGSVGVAAGHVWRDVDAATHPYGLATTGGSFSSVGVVGFTLGTGLGWLGRAHGLAGDNLVSATVVTASGDVIDASERSEPDLYWALRGGTGNFGVVTGVRLRTHPVATVLGGMMVFGLDDAARVIRAVRDMTADAPHCLSWAGVLATAPPAPPWPVPLQGRPVLLVPICWSGDPDRGRSEVERIRVAAGPAALDMVGPLPYPAFQASSDESAPDGQHWDVRSEWLSTLDDGAVDALVHGFADAPGPLSEVLVRPLGGSIADGPDTPFGYRHAGWLLEVLAGWQPGQPATPHQHWMTQVWQSLVRVSAGGPCISHLGIGEPPERGWSSFTPVGLARLRDIKRRYDAGGLFQAAPALR